MHKYIASFDAGCLYELMKREYTKLQREDKFTPEEEMYVEKELKKLDKRIKHMCFQSLSQIQKLHKKIDKLDKYIWFVATIIKPFRELNN
jgi:hypothetical protein